MSRQFSRNPVRHVRLSASGRAIARTRDTSGFESRIVSQLARTMTSISIPGICSLRKRMVGVSRSVSPRCLSLMRRTRMRGPLESKLVCFSQLGLQRIEKGGTRDQTVRFANHLGLIILQTGRIPCMKNSASDRGDTRVTDSKSFAKFDGELDDAKARLHHANRCFFTRIRILTPDFSQHDEAIEIGFKKRHEVRMNIPAVRVAFVPVDKQRRGRAGTAPSPARARARRPLRAGGSSSR